MALIVMRYFDRVERNNQIGKFLRRGDFAAKLHRKNRATFTMQFDHYAQVPGAVAEDIKKKYA